MTPRINTLKLFLLRRPVMILGAVINAFFWLLGVHDSKSFGTPIVFMFLFFQVTEIFAEKKGPSFSRFDRFRSKAIHLMLTGLTSIEVMEGLLKGSPFTFDFLHLSIFAGTFLVVALLESALHSAVNHHGRQKTVSSAQVDFRKARRATFPVVLSKAERLILQLSTNDPYATGVVCSWDMKKKLHYFGPGTTVFALPADRYKLQVHSSAPLSNLGKARLRVATTAAHTEHSDHTEQMIADILVPAKQLSAPPVPAHLAGGLTEASTPKTVEISAQDAANDGTSNTIQTTQMLLQ